MTNERPKNLIEVAVLLEEGIDFPLVFGDFLDEFRSHPSEMALLKPKRLENQYYNAYLAATAEVLAEEYRLVKPEWVDNPENFMPDWVYAQNTKHPKLQKLLQDESPAAFAKRHIAVSANSLSRI